MRETCRIYERRAVPNSTSVFRREKNIRYVLRIYIKLKNVSLLIEYMT